MKSSRRVYEVSLSLSCVHRKSVQDIDCTGTLSSCLSPIRSPSTTVDRVILKFLYRNGK